MNTAAQICLVVVLAAVDIGLTHWLCWHARRKGYRTGWDAAVLAQRVGLHTLLYRERTP